MNLKNKVRFAVVSALAVLLIVSLLLLRNEIASSVESLEPSSPLSPAHPAYQQHGDAAVRRAVQREQQGDAAVRGAVQREQHGDAAVRGAVQQEKHGDAAVRGAVRQEQHGSRSPTVLVTGGAGFIGSHTILLLLQSGSNVVVLDSLVNSSVQSLDRVKQIYEEEKGEALDPKRLVFHNVDLCDLPALTAIFDKAHLDNAGPNGSSTNVGKPYDHCIHFAGLKAVGESMSFPLLYYQNNIASTTNLLSLLDKHACRSLVFSSSATVYGAAAEMPITEATSTGIGITNAYGRTKYFIEGILEDFVKSKEGTEEAWQVAVLR